MKNGFVLIRVGDATYCPVKIHRGPDGDWYWIQALTDVRCEIQDGTEADDIVKASLPPGLYLYYRDLRYYEYSTAQQEAFLLDSSDNIQAKHNLKKLLWLQCLF